MKHLFLIALVMCGFNGLSQKRLQCQTFIQNFSTNETKARDLCYNVEKVKTSNIFLEQEFAKEGLIEFVIKFEDWDDPEMKPHKLASSYSEGGVFYQKYKYSEPTFIQYNRKYKDDNSLVQAIIYNKVYKEWQVITYNNGRYKMYTQSGNNSFVDNFEPKINTTVRNSFDKD